MRGRAQTACGRPRSRSPTPSAQDGPPLITKKSAIPGAIRARAVLQRSALKNADVSTAPLASARIAAQHVEIVDSWPLRTVFFDAERRHGQCRFRRPWQAGSPARLHSFERQRLFQVEKDSTWSNIAKTTLRNKRLHFPRSPDMT